MIQIIKKEEELLIAKVTEECSETSGINGIRTPYFAVCTKTFDNSINNRSVLLAFKVETNKIFRDTNKSFILRANQHNKISEKEYIKYPNIAQMIYSYVSDLITEEKFAIDCGYRKVAFKYLVNEPLLFGAFLHKSYEVTYSEEFEIYTEMDSKGIMRCHKVGQYVGWLIKHDNIGVKCSIPRFFDSYHLGNIIYVMGNVTAQGFLRSLCKLKYVDGNLDLSFSNIKTLKNINYVGGDLIIRDSFIKLEDTQHIDVRGKIIT